MTRNPPSAERPGRFGVRRCRARMARLGEVPAWSDRSSCVFSKLAWPRLGCWRPSKEPAWERSERAPVLRRLGPKIVRLAEVGAIVEVELRRPTANVVPLVRSREAGRCLTGAAVGACCCSSCPPICRTRNGRSEDDPQSLARLATRAEVRGSYSAARHYCNSRFGRWRTDALAAVRPASVGSLQPMTAIDFG